MKAIAVIPLSESVRLFIALIVFVVAILIVAILAFSPRLILLTYLFALDYLIVLSSVIEVIFLVASPVPTSIGFEVRPKVLNTVEFAYFLWC